MSCLNILHGGQYFVRQLRGVSHEKGLAAHCSVSSRLSRDPGTNWRQRSRIQLYPVWKEMKIIQKIWEQGHFFLCPTQTSEASLIVAKCCTLSFFVVGIILKWHIKLRSGNFPKSFFEEMKGKGEAETVCFDANWLCLNILLKNHSS